MRVAVVGAGIVGVATAYELAADGHRVIVFERCASVAAETSFANAGVVAPGYVTPWAAPGIAWKVLAQLPLRHASVRFRGVAPAALPWLWRFLRASRLPVHRANRTRMQRLARYSAQRMDRLAAALELDYERASGYLVLLRDAWQLAAARPSIELLQQLGVEAEVVDPARACTIEPALNAATPLHAALHLPADGVGNCRQFAHQLKGHAQTLGAEFRFARAVTRLRPGSGVEVESAPADGNSPKAPERERFDAVVVCAGLASRRLLAPLRVRLPLLAVFGYSLTLPVRHQEAVPDPGPRAGLMDERYKVAITRLGERIRVAGGAEIGGALDRLHDAPLNTLYKVLEDWFPGAGDLSKAQHWKGARPMLPDGPPVVGASGVDGVWLNVGHGSSGWALACGSARLLADRLRGAAPGFDAEGLGIERLR
jgi:D-amino-acid dehydrogenase